MKSKRISLYFGTTHKSSRPFVATTANGANIAGHTLFIMRFDDKSKAYRRYLVTRLSHFVGRLEASL